MARRTLESLGALVKAKRGGKRLRETAREIGVSPATLMRIENGRTPDIMTFTKICQWLKIDPRELMGYSMESREQISREGRIYASAHLRSDRTPEKETLQALVSMILLVTETQPQPDNRLQDADV